MDRDEFRKWYMGENKGIWKLSNGVVVCDLCTESIAKPEDIRAYGGASYHPYCFEVYADGMFHEGVQGEAREFLLRSLFLNNVTSPR